MAFTLTSDAFADGGDIPAHYTCEGQGVSIPLAWHGAPEEARSFALICEDPDAPGGTFSHWAVWRIPPDRTALPENLPGNARVDSMHQGVNDFGRTGYGPPCPPPGHGPHRYIFRLFALDRETPDVPDGASVAKVLEAVRSHALAEARLTGRYTRGAHGRS